MYITHIHPQFDLPSLSIRKKKTKFTLINKMYITHIHHLIHEYSLSSHIHPQIYTAIIKKKRKKKITRPLMTYRPLVRSPLERRACRNPFHLAVVANNVFQIPRDIVSR